MRRARLGASQDGWEMLARHGSVVVRRCVAGGGYGWRWAGTSWATIVERWDFGWDGRSGRREGGVGDEMRYRTPPFFSISLDDGLD